MLQKRKIVIYIVSILLIAAIAYFIYRFRGKLVKILTPFVMALILAYLLNPLVNKLKRRKIPCNVSILLIYAFFSLALISVMIFIVPELINNTKELVVTLPDITTGYQNMFNGILFNIQSSNWAPDIKNAVFREIQNGLVTLQTYILEALRKSLTKLVEIVTTVMDLILAMIIAYYFIKDAAFFKEATLSLMPRAWRNWMIGTGREINGILSGFIQGQILTAMIVGTLETIGLLIVKVKYPIVLGLVGGVANIIPYFGPIIGAVPAVAVALLDSPVKAVWTAVVFIIVQQIDNAFISPKIIEGKLGLHPVTTILAVLVGGEFFGIIGMLISVPVVAILRAVIRRGIDAIV
ncbi:MAG: AI-2E family transporter [Clostridia bacterium]|nr:AI-2E family transporter [Clostridia bacterium]